MKRLALLVGLMLGPAGLLFACKCAPPPPDLTTRRAFAEYEINSTSVIFEGKVDNMELAGWPIKPVPGSTVSAIPRIIATFSDVRLYRGQTKRFVVETGIGGGDCGYPFETGRSYLVYAWNTDSGQLSTGICSATRPVEKASATEMRLLRGEPPTPEDLVDLRREKQDALQRQPANKVCGKVTLPKGAKTKDMAVFFLPDRGLVLPFGGEGVDAEKDGSFCVDYLDPGKYWVGAMASADSRSRYAGYYPGVRDLSQATSITVSGKEAAPRVEFPIVREPFYLVRGYLRGAPETTNDNDSLKVMLMPSSPDPINMVEPVALGPHGVFEFPAVPPGHYTIFAVKDNAGIDYSTLTFLSLSLQLDISENVEGLALEFVPKK
jgi:hypothetical protein